MTPEELRTLIERGDATQVRARLVQLAERERRTLAVESAKACARGSQGEYQEDAAGVSRWKSAVSDDQREAAHVAFLLTCSLGELAAHAKKYGLGAAEAELLIEARPSWLPQAAQAVLEANPWCWHLARRLVREGLSEAPTSDNFVLGMFGRGFQPWSDKRPLADYLLDDPELLEHGLWRIFEVEGGGELSLAAHDKYSHPDATWNRALLVLLERGHVPRERLLDASLAALERDFAAFRAGWFSRFHEELTPTPAERHARRAKYLRLLGSSIAPTVSFAFEAVKAIDAHASLTADEVLPFIPPVLVARQKGTAKAALKLLASIAKREPSSRAAIARVALDALAHEAADVQGAALDVIESYGGGTFAAELAERAGGLAPSVAKRLGAVAKPTRVEAPAAPADSRLSPARALKPLATVDEVLDRLAHVLEDASDPDELELVLDGVIRLCGAVSANFERRIAPLQKRARAVRRRPGAEWTLPWALGEIVLGWAGEPAERHVSRHEIPALELLGTRATRVASRARARSPGSLLSTPTHRGGWLDPRVLVERVRQHTGEVDLIDASLALLRLAPEERTLSQAKTLDGELGAAVRYALGGTEPVGATAPLWIAAARARAPRQDDPAVEARHPGLGPDAGEVARFAWKVVRRVSSGYTFHDFSIEVTPRAPKKLRLDLPSVLVHLLAGEKPLLRWSSTIWPAGTESYFAQGIARIGNNLDWWEADWSNAVYLEPLRDPFTTFGPNATMLLSLGLAAKEPGESGLAVDAAIAAISDSRLSGVVLGETMAAVMPTGLVKAARWAKTLGVVASASPTHAAHVATAIQRGFRGDPERGPRDEGKLIALLRELLVGLDAKVTDAEAWTYLASTRRKLGDIAPIKG